MSLNIFINGRNRIQEVEETKNFLLQFYPKYQELFKNLALDNIHIEMEKLFFKIHNHFYKNFKEVSLSEVNPTLKK